MRETGDVLYESGHVVDVTVVTLGDELEGDHADGATTLTLGDCVDFDAGGMVLIDGVTYEVTAVDDDANTITISPGLADAMDDGEAVDVWDPLYEVVSSYKSVQARVLSEDSNEDIVDAVLASHLVDKLDEGIRGVHGESVLLELDGDEWRVVDVLGFGEPDSGAGSGTLFFQDSATVTAAGDQTVNLTFVPIEHSEHVYWNGLYQPGTEWTRAGRVVSIADPDELIQPDDVLTVEYAYRVGPVTGVVPPDSYDSTVAASGPWAYWKIEEPSGTAMLDSSGNGRDGTYAAVTLGASGLVPSDPAKSSGDFNGSSSGGTFTGAPSVATAWTLEAIVKPDSASGTQIVLADWGFGDPATRFNLGTVGGVLVATVHTNADGNVTATGPSLAVGTTYHLVATHDGTSILLYVNGVLVGTDTTTELSSTSSGVCTVGYDNAAFLGAPNHFWNGQIQKAAIYTFAMNALDIAEHFAASGL